MLYGYRRPAGPTFALSAGDNPDWETDIRLANSQPSEQTVISGAFPVVQDTADYVDVQMSWAAPQPIGAVALLNLSVPAGCKIEVTGRQVGDGGYARDLGGNSVSAATLVEGRVQLIVATTNEDDDFIGIQVRIYNDAGGVAWGDDDTDIYLGEIGVFAAVKLCARIVRQRGRSNRTVRDRAASGALHVYPRGEYRSESLAITGTIADAYQSSPSWQQLQGMQDARLYRALVIPRGLGDYKQPPDYGLVQHKALFGTVTWGRIVEEEAIMRAATTLDVEEAV